MGDWWDPDFIPQRPEDWDPQDFDNSVLGLLATKYVWNTWGDNCPICDSLRGTVQTMDFWINCGLYPGFHVNCNCTLARVPDDTPVSDPDIFGTHISEALLHHSRNLCACTETWRVPKLEFGNKVVPPNTLPPIGHHLDQPRPPGIISRAGIAPRQRIVYVTSFQRIVVHVLQLLPHHLLSADLFRPTPLLPELIFASCFMP